MSQNTSHAVMQQRHEAKDSLDDFPTPPWATRALIEYILSSKLCKEKSVYEPACGRGYMYKVLREYFKAIVGSDIYCYDFIGHPKEFGATTLSKSIDYLNTGSANTDWIITNPPFNKAKEFARKAIPEAKEGVALLVRSAFLEGKDRFESLFRPYPPSIVAQFVERVPMVRGRVDPNVSTATSYCWVIWAPKVFGNDQIPRLFWIPPCRKELTRDGDYD